MMMMFSIFIEHPRPTGQLFSQFISSLTAAGSVTEAATTIVIYSVLRQSSTVTATVIHCDGHPLRQSFTTTVIHCDSHPLQRSSTAPVIHCDSDGHPLRWSSTATAIYCNGSSPTATVICCDGHTLLRRSPIVTVIYCDGHSLQRPSTLPRRSSTMMVSVGR